jgi:hypothetical protein
LKFLDGRILFRQNEKSLGLTQEKFVPQLHGQPPQEQVYAGIGSDVSDEFKCRIPRHQEPGRSLSTVEIRSATAIFVAFENIPRLDHPGCRIRECATSRAAIERDVSNTSNCRNQATRERCSAIEQNKWNLRSVEAALA